LREMASLFHCSGYYFQSQVDDLLAFSIERIIGKSSSALALMVKKSIFDRPGKYYAWPGNVRELGQCIRRILLKRTYTSIFTHSPAGTLSGLAKDMERGNIDAKRLVQEYCRLLYDDFGTYGEVARRTGLDRRTVKKHVDVKS